jgi:hypothetical protein
MKVDSRRMNRSPPPSAISLLAIYLNDAGQKWTLVGKLRILWLKEHRTEAYYGAF